MILRPHDHMIIWSYGHLFIRSYDRVVTSFRWDLNSALIYSPLLITRFDGRQGFLFKLRRGIFRYLTDSALIYPPLLINIAS